MRDPHEQGISANQLQIRWLVPLHGDAILDILKDARHTIIVENNYSGQFARYLRSETSYVPNGYIRKYDGEPFMPHHIVGAVKEQLGGKSTFPFPRTKSWFEEKRTMATALADSQERGNGRLERQSRSRLVSRMRRFWRAGRGRKRRWSSCRSRTTKWSRSAASAVRPTSPASSTLTACTLYTAGRWRSPPE